MVVQFTVGKIQQKSATKLKSYFLVFYLTFLCTIKILGNNKILGKIDSYILYGRKRYSYFTETYVKIQIVLLKNTVNYL